MAANSTQPDLMILSANVRDAIRGGGPLVALESALITHGLPYPDNLNVALSMEGAVRDLGAVPATIGVLRGEIRVGLNADELATLAQGEGLTKFSTRDLGAAASLHLSGGTTVAATMFVAGKCGIQVLATGGIGGVHQGRTFDVSADLGALREGRMVVVCAGAKSILDLPSTLEVLESHGVPVLGYRTNEFPAFYSRQSGLRVTARIDSSAQAAVYWNFHSRLGLPSAVLLTNPIPESAAVPAELVNAWTAQAVKDANTSGISGNALTPFLLARVAEISGGRSMRANEALLLSNAQLAAQVAMAIAKPASTKEMTQA